MVEPIAIATVSAFSTVLKGLQSIKDLAVSVEVKAKVTELYDVIITGQQSALEENIKQRALLEDVRDLKAQIAQMEAWDAEKQRYSLAQPWRGAVVYALKESAAAGEPAHYICTHCYADGKKSVLNLTKASDGFSVFVCRCRAQVRTPYRGQVGFRFAEQLGGEAE